MTLIVTDAHGHKYRPTGHFREPEPGDFLYCFDHKRVERRPFPKNHYSAYGTWCSNGHVEFLLNRIIVEPLPVEYEVTLRLTQAEIDAIHKCATHEGYELSLGRRVCGAVHNGDYLEARDA